MTLDVAGRLCKASTGGDEVEFAVYHDWNQALCLYHEELAVSDMWIVRDKLIELAGEGELYLLIPCLITIAIVAIIQFCLSSLG